MRKSLTNILIIITAIVAVALIATMVVLYHNTNPLESNIFPQCAFYKITGYQCPGCGAQRAIHFFLNGDFHMAFKMNPLLWIALAYGAVLLSLKTPWLRERGASLHAKLSGLVACISWFVGIIAFWVLRNL